MLERMKLRLGLCITVASVMALVASCSSADDAASENAGDSGSGDGAAAGDGATSEATSEDARVGDAGDAGDAADATDGGDAALVDAADAGLTWLRYEFPETSYPNGWLVASQGNSPNNWTAAAIGGASALDVHTDDGTGGGACMSSATCIASQCVGGTCRQRVKQKSPRADLAAGVYQWRIYVAQPSPADAQFSAGAFVYADDLHELDFECGAGTLTARQSATLPHLDGTMGPALATEMLCYATSQANPFVSTPTAVTTSTWHTLELAMSEDANGHYEVTWRIDGVTVLARLLTYGPTDDCAMYVAGRKCTWQAFVSTENLGFMGDSYPTVRNDAYFDWFQYGK